MEDLHLHLLLLLVLELYFWDSPSFVFPCFWLLLLLRFRLMLFSLIGCKGLFGVYLFIVEFILSLFLQLESS
jgi:hypothetical protein